MPRVVYSRVYSMYAMICVFMGLQTAPCCMYNALTFMAQNPRHNGIAPLCKQQCSNVTLGGV